jgi:opacity protein-like surface antigen
MRVLAIAGFSALLMLPAAASAQSRGGAIQGFGGTTFGTSASAPTFGGNIAFPLGDHVQLVGEAGRMTDIKARLLDDLVDLSPADIGLAAWYAEGGVRFTGSRQMAVRPYVEATAGVARLKPSVGVDGWLGALTNTGLSFLGSTETLVGAGGGVIVEGGPVVVDVGYRYKRILADSALATVFALGDDGLNVNQVRVGVGFRF